MKRNSLFPAVVLGMGAGGLAVVRSLAAHGVSVYGIHTDTQEHGRLSRRCRSLRFPSVAAHENEYLERLLELGCQIGRQAALIPASDEKAAFISRHRERLSRDFLFALPEGDFVERLVSKRFMRDLAAQHGLRIPCTEYPATAEDVTRTATEMHGPFLIKPLNSFSTGFPGKNLTARDGDALQALFAREPSFLGNTVIQEIIPGGDRNIYQVQAFIGDDGNAVAVMTFRKLRQCPPGLGIGCFIASHSLPDVDRQALQFLKAIDYRGFAGLEFKKHSGTGTYYFIEINPRIPWCLALARDCGVDLAYAGYRATTQPGSTWNLDVSQHNDVVWMDFNRDLLSFIRKRSAGEILIRHWIPSLLRARSFAFWSLSDPAPFLRSTASLVRDSMRGLRRWSKTGRFLSRQQDDLIHYITG